MAGVDLNTVRELLGHKDMNLTLRYAHLSPDHKSKALEILARKMDTRWPPEENFGVSDNFRNAVNHDIGNINHLIAHVAQSVEQRFRKREEDPSQVTDITP